MADNRGVHEGLATPVHVLSEVEVADRKVKAGLATPVYIINPSDPCEDCDGSGGGGAGDLTYVFNQIVPSATWNINHNLSKFPSVTVVDSADSVVFGDVTHIDNNNLTVTFNSAFSGKAYLN